MVCLIQIALDLSKIICKEKSLKFFPKYLLSLASPLCIIWLMCAWPRGRNLSIVEFQSWGALYFLFLKNIINLCFLVPLLSKSSKIEISRPPLTRTLVACLWKLKYYVRLWLYEFRRLFRVKVNPNWLQNSLRKMTSIFKSLKSRKKKLFSFVFIKIFLLSLKKINWQQLFFLLLFSSLWARHVKSTTTNNPMPFFSWKTSTTIFHFWELTDMIFGCWIRKKWFLLKVVNFFLPWILWEL